VKTELDFGDHSELIRVERDSALCELHNGDVGILCGWPNFRKKSCVLVSLMLIYFMFLFKICSCLELELTINLNTRVMLILVVSVISLSSTLSSLLIVSLSGPRHTILTPDLLFCCTKFLMTEYIQPPNRTYPT
jgi:predicted acyltransferase